MNAYTVEVAYHARSYGADNPRYRDVAIGAPDKETAEELAIAVVEASGAADDGSITVVSVVEDEENDATIQKLIATLRKEFAPREVPS